MWKWLVITVLSADPQFGLSTGNQRPPPPPPPPRDVCSAPRAPDRSCTRDEDCATVTRTVSCCGTQTINGINRGDVSGFGDYQRRCVPGRRCGCAAGPTTLDDGTRLESYEQVRVACRANLCTTYRDPQACTRAECGPAPAYPTRLCPDGVHTSGRGPCARVEGQCRWTRLECP